MPARCSLRAEHRSTSKTETRAPVSLGFWHLGANWSWALRSRPTAPAGPELASAEMGWSSAGASSSAEPAAVLRAAA